MGKKKKKKKKKSPEGFWEPLAHVAVAGAGAAMAARSAAHIADVWWTCNQLYTDACESLPVLYTDAVTILGMGAYLTYIAGKHYLRNVGNAAKYGDLYVSRTRPSKRPSDFDYPDELDYRPNYRRRERRHGSPNRRSRNNYDFLNEAEELGLGRYRDPDIDEEELINTDFLSEARREGLGRYGRR